MRVLVTHNRYRFSGGEDSVVQNEVEMLRAAGHEVAMLEADNRTIEGPLATIAAAGSVFHSAHSRRRAESLLQEFHPDVMHVHNWFPLLSPSVITACAKRRVPVVQTLHNFRMVCAGASLFRNGRICCDCIGQRLPLAPVLHGCYTGSRAGSAVVAAAFAWHRLAHTWNDVSIFIALTEFQRELLVRGGVDAAKTVVKPNFVGGRGGKSAGKGRGGYALFAGRLVPEKGIRTVLRAWEENAHLPRLKIMGDGPLSIEVRARAMRLPHVEFLGQQSRFAVAEAMADARLLVFASECYEPFALVILEALAAGTPVVAADLPSIAELVEEGETGLHFVPGDARDLTAKISTISVETPAYHAMRRRCRATYEQRYSEAINYPLLMDIYRRAVMSAQIVRKSLCKPGAEAYGAMRR
jgi:glycosyltransferase involved in cell wall biosynthesis